MAEQVLFQEYQKVAAQKPALQSWARSVADHRESFHDCMLLEASDTTQGFMYMYGTKNPKVVHLKPLKQVSPKPTTFVDPSASFGFLEKERQSGMCMNMQCAVLSLTNEDLQH